jgi:hypothetical protein
VCGDSHRRVQLIIADFWIGPYNRFSLKPSNSLSDQTSAFEDAFINFSGPATQDCPWDMDVLLAFAGLTKHILIVAGLLLFQRESRLQLW